MSKDVICLNGEEPATEPMESALDKHHRDTTDSESNAIKAQLPFNSFTLMGSLKIFNRLAILTTLKEYIPMNSEDNFFAGIRAEAERAMMYTNLNKFKLHVVLEQMFVIAHELSHFGFAHLAGKRKGSHKAWNCAEDLIINEALIKYFGAHLKPPTENGKRIGLFFEDLCVNFFKNTTYNNHVVTREGVPYELEALNSAIVYKWMMEDAPEGDDGEDCDEDCEDDGDGDGTGEGGNGKGKKDKNVKPRPAKQKTIDDLDKERLDRHDGTGLDKSNLGPKLQRVLADLMKSAEDGVYGTEAGKFAKVLKRIHKKHFPFRDVLDKVFRQEKLDFSRGNRRLTGALSDSFFPRRRNEDFKTWAIVDMSGSCEFYAPDFLGYVAALPSFEAVYCIDTTIRHVVKKGEPLPKIVYGCGGTDLNPAFKACEEIEKKNPNVKCNFIILTDGEIPDVTHGPRKSLVLTFTTHLDVTFHKASRKWQNIDISDKLIGGDKQ